MLCPKVPCYLQPNWRCICPCLSSQAAWGKLLSVVTGTVGRTGVAMVAKPSQPLKDSHTF